MTAIRRLAAILAADVVGYSRMMGENEEGTLERLKAVRAELVDPTIAQHRGRIFKTMGDGLLVEFASVVDAVKCAISIQHRMSERTVRSMVEERIEFRIGVNVGDVIIDGEDIYGDGVNIAARLEPLAEPGGICVSGRVYDDAPGRIDAEFEDLGEQRLKNINRAVRVYKVRARVEAAAPGQSPSGFGVPVPGDQGVRSELFDWLSSHELSKYYPVFVAHDVDLPTLHELTEKDLETLEIPMGARRRLLASFVGRQTLSAESGSPLASSTQILRKIGYLGVGPRPDHDEFRRSLGVYGYIDGKTLGVEYRWCDGVYQRYPALLKELIEQRVELIVADATPAVAAAKEATSTTPIVMVGVGDPIGYGIVPSLMRPGGNITGISMGLHELLPRGLRLVKEILPQAVRVAILSNTKHQPGSAPAVRLVEDTAHALDMLRRAYDAGDADELRAVFSRLDRRECDALFLIGDHSLVQNRMIIINAAADLGIPLICAEPLVVADGGFMCLGRNRPEIYRRLAYYVDTILKGTPPGDLPIEEPSKSTLVFNLKTAKALGITIPGPILMRADHLIE